MAEVLQDRIRRGDFVALTDPAFELTLLAEPGADWWRKGSYQAALRLVARYAADCEVAPCVAAVQKWAFPLLDPNWVRDLHRRLGWISEAAGHHPEAAGLHFGLEITSAAAYVAQMQQQQAAPHARMVIDLARRLRALVPSAPSEVDEALAVLERYAG